MLARLSFKKHGLRFAVRVCSVWVCITHTSHRPSAFPTYKTFSILTRKFVSTFVRPIGTRTISDFFVGPSMVVDGGLGGPAGLVGGSPVESYLV